MTPIARASLVALSLVLVPACHSSGSSSEEPVAAAAEAEVAVNGELGTEAFVEDHDDGSVAWRIDPTGDVKAAVSTSAGARIKTDLGGTLIYKVQGAEPKTVPLTLDAKTGLLVAAVPKLEADLTEIDYTITVSGKPWSGVMHVPVGGTVALVASGKAMADAKLADDAVGPHGGTIQIVGSDRLEMVADAKTGETRVYVLAVDLTPVRIETRTLRMGFVAETTTFVNFVPDPAGFFFTATVGAAFLNPLQVTAAVGFGGVTYAALWGFHPGVRVYAPSATVKIAAAPRVRFVLTAGFDGSVDVYGRAHAKVAARDRDDDDDRGKGNNGRQTGKDGTRDRDSGGFKDDDRGGKARGGDRGGGKGNGHDPDDGGGSHGGGKSGGGHDSHGGDSHGGGNSSHGGGHDSTGGSSHGGGKSSGGGAKSGGGGGGSKGGGGGKGGGGRGGKK